MRTRLLISAAGLVVLAACQQTTSAPTSGAASTAAAAGAQAPADSQMMSSAQNMLNRYGFGDVDANTLSRDQVIRINRIDTLGQRAPEIRREISAILARS